MIGPLALPDVPRWIEAHGIAADPASWRSELGAGFAVGNDRARLIGQFGRKTRRVNRERQVAARPTSDARHVLDDVIGRNKDVVKGG